ncbi:MAG: hypothetical protein ACM3PE_08650 [Deltaproteobacteria bacterium]
MNNKVYMQASLVIADPAFKEAVSSLKDSLGGLPTEFMIDSDVIVLAQTAILIDTTNPDFSAAAGRIVMITGTAAEKTIPESDMLRTIWAIVQMFEKGYSLISKFFPIEQYGLPSMGLWTWIMRYLVENTLPQPQLGSPPLIISRDPESILLRAKLQYLERELGKGRTDSQNILEEAYRLEDRMAEIVSNEVRILVEILPGANPKERIAKLPAIINKVFSDMGTDLLSYKIPADFDHKVERIVIPRQFQGHTLESIALAENRAESNISRDYNQIIGKTGYQPIPQKPRGPNRI